MFYHPWQQQERIVYVRNTNFRLSFAFVLALGPNIPFLILCLLFTFLLMLFELVLCIRNECKLTIIQLLLLLLSILYWTLICYLFFLLKNYATNRIDVTLYRNVLSTPSSAYIVHTIFWYISNRFVESTRSKRWT